MNKTYPSETEKDLLENVRGKLARWNKLYNWNDESGDVYQDSELQLRQVLDRAYGLLVNILDKEIEKRYSDVSSK